MKKVKQEICVHEKGRDPLTCWECTVALVMNNPVARAAYEKNKQKREREEKKRKGVK